MGKIIGNMKIAGTFCKQTLKRIIYDIEIQRAIARPVITKLLLIEYLRCQALFEELHKFIYAIELRPHNIFRFIADNRFRVAAIFLLKKAKVVGLFCRNRYIRRRKLLLWRPSPLRLIGLDTLLKLAIHPDFYDLQVFRIEAHFHFPAAETGRHAILPGEK
jgi:hypothetical protein